MNVTYHVYHNIVLNRAGSSDEEIAQQERNNLQVRKLRYSLVSLAWDDIADMLYVGTTNFAGDILARFDPRRGSFQSCGYADSGLYCPEEHKIHRGIWFDHDANALFFGTASVAAMAETIVSPGAALLRYDIVKSRFDLIARPTPGCFYQATGYDPRRKLMYMYSEPDAAFSVYDLGAGRLRRHNPMSSIPHIGCIDDQGGVWGTYDSALHAFFRYDPDRDAFDFCPECRFPNSWEASHVMYPGAGPVDGFVNGGDGYLYVASALAEIYRLDPRTRQLLYLGKPFPGKRSSGMAVGGDGGIYIAGGTDNDPQLVRYDRKTGAFRTLGRIRAADGETCYRCHDLLIHGDKAYVAETDNPRRSGFLWECSL